MALPGSVLRFRSPSKMTDMRRAVRAKGCSVTLTGGCHLMRRAPPVLFQRRFGFHACAAFVINFFSRGWVTLPKSLVSRAISFRLLACRHRRSGRNRSSRRIIARLRKFRWCSSCDYPSEHSGLRATHLYHRSAVCRAVPMVLFPGAAALRFPFRPSQNLNLQRRCLF